MRKPYIRNETRKIKRLKKILKNRDIPKYRSRELESQKGIDPITREVITKPTQDHSHVTGNLRMCLQNESNQFLGRIESFYGRYIKYKKLDITLPEILRNIADYLEKDYSDNAIHPKSITDVCQRFGRMKVEEQNNILFELGLSIEGSKKDKQKRYRKYLMRDENILKF